MAALSGTSLLNVWFVWIATFRNRPILLKNSVSRATPKFEKNFVRSRARPSALFSGAELRQEEFS